MADYAESPASRAALADEVVASEVAEAFTLPSSWYTRDDVFRAERRRVFGASWQLVAHQQALAAPGDYVTVELVGEPLLLVRGDDGVLRAFYNVCRHRAGPVAVGAGCRHGFQCAYHGWTYSWDGRLTQAREIAGTRRFDPGDFGLAPVAVDAWGPLVFVNLDPAAAPLDQVMAPITEEMAQAGFRWDGVAPRVRRDYEIRCNWKVYVDNYLEGYHIPLVHPGLFRELDYARYRVEPRGHYSKQISPTRSAGQNAPGTGYGRYAAGTEALYYWLWPNLMLNVYPDNVSTNVILPLGVGRTLTIFEWLFAPGADAAEVDDTVAFSDQVQQEDIVICEAVARGLQSASYHRGRFVAARENGVHHFHRLMAERLAAAVGGGPGL